LRKLINARYDHVALFVTDNLLVESTPQGGVKIIEFEKYKYEDYRMLKIKDPSVIDKMIDFHLLKVGKGYDFINLIGLYFTIILNLNKQLSILDVPDAFLCCELMADSAQYAGFNFDESLDKDFLTPAHIINSDKIKVVT